MNKETEDPRLFSILSGKPFPGKKPKPKSSKNLSSQSHPMPPMMLPEMAVFDESSHKILQKQKITKKQFARYVEQLTYYALTHGSAEWVRSLIDGIRTGKARDMNSFEEIMGLVKKGGFVFNFDQRNLTVNNNANGSSRDFNALLKSIEQEEREMQAIETTAIPALPEAVDDSSA